MSRSAGCSHNSYPYNFPVFYSLFFQDNQLYYKYQILRNILSPNKLNYPEEKYSVNIDDGRWSRFASGKTKLTKTLKQAILSTDISDLSTILSPYIESGREKLNVFSGLMERHVVFIENKCIHSKVLEAAKSDENADVIIAKLYQYSVKYGKDYPLNRADIEFLREVLEYYLK